MSLLRRVTRASVWLGVLMLFGLMILMPDSSCAQTKEYEEIQADQITYHVWFNAGYAMVSTCPEDIMGEITIPSTVRYNGKDYPVTIIDDYAFEYREISAIVLPESIEEIRSHAFEDCRELVTIRIPGKVNKIGVNAFAGCSSLTGFEIVEGNTQYKVWEGALYDASLTSLVSYPGGKGGDVTFPPTITRIEDGPSKDAPRW